MIYFLFRKLITSNEKTLRKISHLHLCLSFYICYIWNMGKCFIQSYISFVFLFGWDSWPKYQSFLLHFQNLWWSYWYVPLHNLYMFCSWVSDGLRPMFQYSSLQYHMNHTCSTANTHQRISISLYHLFLLYFVFQSSSWIVESAL